uniref:Histone deacetylase 11 n=1 Tax=Ascaris lumbricoides TaxID=6252 RepID=A0A9J2P5T8_ASCLU
MRGADSEDEEHGESSALKSSCSSISRKEKLAYVTETRLYSGIRADQWPIVYHSLYNISFFGIEKLHPFDSAKWGRVYNKLIESGMLTEEQFVQAVEASEHDLRVVHTSCYLASLHCPCRVARLVEVAIVAFLPSFVIDKYLLKPFRYHTAGGSILAARLALERNWAINLGGGFHHASRSRGGGFCVYADISLALNFLFLNRLISRAMIVDLDAHQGNGHEHDFAGDNRVYIFDMFNYQIYPSDFVAKNAISRSVPLRSGTGDTEYLRQLSRNLSAALGEFSADIIIYNAGTDCLEGDPLGLLSLTAAGIIKRDEVVFELAQQCHIPIVMLMSGGYMPNNYDVITRSILNLHQKKLISLPASPF